MQINNEAKSSPPNGLHTPGQRVPAAHLSINISAHGRLSSGLCWSNTTVSMQWCRKANSLLELNWIFTSSELLSLCRWPLAVVKVSGGGFAKGAPLRNYYPKSNFFFFFAASIWPCVWHTAPQRVQASAKAKCGPINFCVRLQLRGCALDSRLLEAGRINFTHRFI